MKNNFFFMEKYNKKKKKKTLDNYLFKPSFNEKKLINQ